MTWDGPSESFALFLVRNPREYGGSPAPAGAGLPIWIEGYFHSPSGYFPSWVICRRAATTMGLSAA